MKYTILAVLALFFAAACTNEQETGKDNAVLKVLLTDAPAGYQEVLIEIDSVLYHMEGSMEEGSWKTLDMVNHGSYNLLDLTDGMDTLIAEATLPAGRISQMRLVLGHHNRIMVDSTYYDLETPSAETSGLKFQLKADLEEGQVYRMWIDFDAARSVMETGNGKFILHPVIRTFAEGDSAAMHMTSLVSLPDTTM